METLTYNLKKIVCAAFIGTLIFGSDVIKAQEELVPDQNPNYRKSMDKYMANKEDLVKTEGTTLQNTYKAIDDMQIKQERRAARRSYRQQRRLARANYGGYYYSYPYNYGYNSYGYNSYYPYSNYSSSYNYYNPYCGLNTIASTALLGLGLYWWLR